MRRDDFLREYRRRHLKKQDDSLQRDYTELPSSRSEVEPFQYYIPDELRGRDIAELRSTLKNIWLEERKESKRWGLRKT